MARWSFSRERRGEPVGRPTDALKAEQDDGKLSI